MTSADFISELEQVVSSWQGITVEPHRFGGREFKLNGTEIGHIHLNGLLDVPFSRAIRDALVKEGKVKPHHILPGTGWISFYAENSSASFEDSIRLLRLSYLFRLSRKPLPGERQIPDEVQKLNFGEVINKLMTK